MKNLKQISDQTQQINSSNKATWIKLYYSFKENAIYTEPGPGRLFVTDLINPNTPDEITAALETWKNL